MMALFCLVMCEVAYQIMEFTKRKVEIKKVSTKGLQEDTNCILAMGAYVNIMLLIAVTCCQGELDILLWRWALVKHSI